MNKILHLTNRQLKSLYKQYKNGEVSMRQIDDEIGVPQRGGKHIRMLWKNAGLL